MREVINSYVHDDRAPIELDVVVRNDSNNNNARLEDQVGDINARSIPIADDAWQRVEEYEKDALLATQQTDILQQRLRDESQQRRRSQKKKRAVRRRKRKKNDAIDIPDVPPTLDQDEGAYAEGTFAEGTSGGGGEGDGRCVELVPPNVPLTLDDVMHELPIETLQQEALRNDQDARFLTHESIYQRIPEEAVATAPKYSDVVSWVGKMTERPLWFRQLPQLCVDTGTEFPKLEVVTWSHVQKMLHEADPSCPWQRPCLPPVDQSTGRAYACESERMGGPRLREFLLPSQLDALEEAVERYEQAPTGQNTWTYALPTNRQMCFLCRQHCVTTSFMRHKFENNEQNQNRRDTDAMVLIHDYIMAVNVPGEWDIAETLPGYDVPCGLAGPVLRHDRKHYVYRKYDIHKPGKCPDKTHLDGWTMVDQVFFRPGVTRM